MYLFYVFGSFATIRHYRARHHILGRTDGLSRLFITLTLKMHKSFLVRNFMIFNFYMNYFYCKVNICKDIVKKLKKSLKIQDGGDLQTSEGRRIFIN